MLSIRFVFLIALAYCFLACCTCTRNEGRPDNDHGKKNDQSREELQEHKENLRKKAKHFVGKVDPKGTAKHNGKKTKNVDRKANPKAIFWKGQLTMSKGASANDTPEVVRLPENITELAKFQKKCLKSHKNYPNTTGSETSSGPKAEGFVADDFAPCSERKRGKKRSGTPLPRVAPKSRGKRSESYTYPSMLWKDPANIPYVFDRSISETVKATIKTAQSYWQNHSCIGFTQKQTPPSEPYILFAASGSTCSTDRLGPNPYPPYSTKIDLGICSEAMGSIVHEIGHALGLSHSQKRVDRDAAIKIFTANIAASWASQFDRDSSQYFDGWSVPYYYDSIMHYFPYAASSNSLMTICPLNPLMEMVMGQRIEPSFGDIALINNIYCQESCYKKDQMKTVKFTGDKSRTISGRPCQNWSLQTPHRHSFTSVGNHSNCRSPDGWEGGPWCYTTDPTVRYEPCFSPCETLTLANEANCEGWCNNGGYHDPSTCACLCPPYARGAHCELFNETALYAHVPCGGKVQLKTIGAKANITSPQWPNNYSHSTLCVWWIQAPVGAEVRLDILNFALEVPDQTGCYDYLEIRPSICASAIEEPEEMRFCGNSLANTNTTSKRYMFSDDNNMVLKFLSDEGENAKGFSVVAEAVPAT